MKLRNVFQIRLWPLIIRIRSDGGTCFRKEMMKKMVKNNSK